MVTKELRKGFNHVVILVAWELWKHRNAAVFERISPYVQFVLQMTEEECQLWCLAGASALQELILGHLLQALSGLV